LAQGPTPEVLFYEPCNRPGAQAGGSGSSSGLAAEQQTPQASQQQQQQQTPQASQHQHQQQQQRPQPLSSAQQGGSGVEGQYWDEEGHLRANAWWEQQQKLAGKGKVQLADAAAAGPGAAKHNVSQRHAGYDEPSLGEAWHLAQGPRPAMVFYEPCDQPGAQAGGSSSSGLAGQQQTPQASQHPQQQQQQQPHSTVLQGGSGVQGQYRPSYSFPAGTIFEDRRQGAANPVLPPAPGLVFSAAFQRQPSAAGCGQGSSTAQHPAAELGVASIGQRMMGMQQERERGQLDLPGKLRLVTHEAEVYKRFKAGCRGEPAAVVCGVTPHAAVTKCCRAAAQGLGTDTCLQQIDSQRDCSQHAGHSSHHSLPSVQCP